MTFFGRHVPADTPWQYSKLDPYAIRESHMRVYNVFVITHSYSASKMDRRKG